MGVKVKSSLFIVLSTVSYVFVISLVFFRGSDLMWQTQSPPLHRTSLHSQAGRSGSDRGAQRSVRLQSQWDAIT